MSDNGESPRMPDGPVRDNAAWRLYFEHERNMARATHVSTVPTVTVEIEDAAKGEVRVSTKVSAPFGADMEAFAQHVGAVRRIAEEQHQWNKARRTQEEAELIESRRMDRPAAKRAT